MYFEFISEKDVCIYLYFLIPQRYLDSIEIVSMMRFIQQVFSVSFFVPSDIFTWTYYIRYKIWILDKRNLIEKVKYWN